MHLKTKLKYYGVAFDTNGLSNHAETMPVIGLFIGSLLFHHRALYKAHCKLPSFAITHAVLVYTDKPFLYIFGNAVCQIILKEIHLTLTLPLIPTISNNYGKAPVHEEIIRCSSADPSISNQLMPNSLALTVRFFVLLWH